MQGDQSQTLSLRCKRQNATGLHRRLPSIGVGRMWSGLLNAVPGFRGPTVNNLLNNILWVQLQARAPETNLIGAVYIV